MRFLNQNKRLVQEAYRARKEHGSARRRSSPISLEMLETRNLMSVAGVTLRFDNLAIVVPTGSHGNVALVSIDHSNHDVKVVFNGQSEEFSPSLVANITYEGGSGGGDTFTNDTSLVSLDYGFGTGNNFTGGTGFNYVEFFGSDNTYNTQAGSFTDVFEIGSSDTINNPSHATVQIYVY